MKYQLSNSTIIHSRSDLIVSQIGDEVVMMDIAQGNYYGLNHVASRIWQLLDKDMSVAAICEQLLMEYDIAPAACASEVFCFVTRMIEEGLVEIRTEDGVHDEDQMSY